MQHTERQKKACKDQYGCFHGVVVALDVVEININVVASTSTSYLLPSLLSAFHFLEDAVVVIVAVIVAVIVSPLLPYLLPSLLPSLVEKNYKVCFHVAKRFEQSTCTLR